MYFDCYYSIDQWTHVGDGSKFTSTTIYQCIVDFIIDSDLSKVTNVSQNHFEGKTNDDITGLDIKKKDLQIFPRDIEFFYPNLEEIDARYNQIEAITKDVLNFPNLRRIRFDLNKIITIEDDLFSFTPNLQYVSFNYNIIKNVTTKAFEPLKNLRVILMEGVNNCINENARTRDEVENLISKIPEACPPMNELTKLEIKTEKIYLNFWRRKPKDKHQ